ncbi:uncharacterized protein LOC144642426 [Oculina patagonica]
MNKLKEDKLSTTMKEALARNSAVQNKMKASMGAMSSEQKKMLQSMESYKEKYAKRQRELQTEKQRMLNSRRMSDDDGTGSRKISAPACMVTVVEYKDVSSGGFITQAQPRAQTTHPRQQRSISMPSDGRLPSLHCGENGGKSPESAVGEKNGGLILPAIWPNGANQGRQRKLSVASLSGPTSTGLIVPAMDNAQSRSAPNSPCAPRRELNVRIPSPNPRARSKSPGRELQRTKLAADLQQALANTKEFGLQRQNAIEVAEKEPEAKTSSESFEKVLDHPKTRKISSPGTTLSFSHPLEQATNGNSETTLEESLNQIRFCQYLRSPSLPEDEEKLPDELIPKAMIVGHTKWVAW